MTTDLTTRSYTPYPTIIWLVCPLILVHMDDSLRSDLVVIRLHCTLLASTRILDDCSTLDVLPFVPSTEVQARTRFVDEDLE